MPKDVIVPLHILKAGSMSGNLTSDTINVQYLDNIGIQVSWTGSPTGTFQVRGTVDGVNFIALTFDPVLEAATGSADSFLINLNQFPFKSYQVGYVAGSGTGTLDVWATEKGI